MKQKVHERAQAIELRKKGHSYKEILKKVSVSKSSLSLWLKDLPLTEEEEQYLRMRKDANIARGRVQAAASLHKQRIRRDQLLFSNTKRDFEAFIDDPFFGIGLALYWAEGAKKSSVFAFSNSDEEMVCIMVRWIEKYLSNPREQLTATLYTHHPFERQNLELFWSQKTGIPIRNFRKTVVKPIGLPVKKRPNYKGCLRIATKNGTVKLRKMLFWQSLLEKHLSKAEKRL